ncbi:MAG: hypothetical protein ABJN65_11600 [Parasphingorhabdus sp.]
MSGIFYVRDFGATGSESDERQAIQACLDAAGVGANESVQVFGNNFYGKYGSFSIGENTQDIKITNNILRAGDLGRGGNIWMVAPSPDTIEGIDISDNVIRDGQTHAINFGRLGYKNLSIRNNTIFVTQAGERLAAMPGGGIFQGNDVTFSGNALQGHAYIGDFTNCTMGGNSFTNLSGNTAQAYLRGAIEQWPDNYLSSNVKRDRKPRRFLMD